MPRGRQNRTRRRRANQRDRSRSYDRVPPPRPRRRSRSPDYSQRPVYLVKGQEEPEEAEDTEHQETSVRYRAVFKTERGGAVVHDVSAWKPFAAPQEASREVDSVFDVVTEYLTVTPEPPSYRYDEFEPRIRRRVRSPSPPSSEEGDMKLIRRPTGPPTLQVASLRGTQRVDIHSTAIIHALQQVVRYYPGHNLVGETVVIQEPYMLLIHHKKELEAFRDNHAPGKLKSEDTCDKEADTYEHLGILQSYLNNTNMKSVDAELGRHAKGKATWEMLWLLLKPGTDVVVTIKDEPKSKNFRPFPRGYVVEEILGGPLTNTDRKEWEIRCWSLDYDGTTIGRIDHVHWIEQFDGEVDVTSLGIIPADWPGHERDGMPIADILRRDGKYSYELLTPRCLQHDGKSMEFPYNEVDGLVMVDMKTFFADNSNERPFFIAPATAGVGVADCSCPVCVKRKPDTQARLPPFAGYDSIEPGKELTNHQCFLFPNRVFVFHFRTRMWELVDVGNLQTAQFKPDILNTLVMSPDRINMLKALSKKYMRTEDGTGEIKQGFWSADFIEGKGKSQIILLHGKPGVGKTYTAECIAEHTRRPLMTLTCADIGTDPEDVEENLEYHFTAARDWGALVLIDEADIYMEKRASNDLTRNSLVAGFLRALEVYEGMLFLTTNRVGAFDDAFVSRIHVKLYYPPLTDSDRKKIWRSFIEKLGRERQKDIRVTIDAKDYINGKAVRQLDLNGREIRNAFQTAVALAEFENHKDEEGRTLVEEHHIQQVADMSKDFKKYLDDLHQGDEAKRAIRSIDRNDAWPGAEEGEDEDV